MAVALVLVDLLVDVLITCVDRELLDVALPPDPALTVITAAEALLTDAEAL